MFGRERASIAVVVARFCSGRQSAVVRELGICGRQRARYQAAWAGRKSQAIFLLRDAACMAAYRCPKSAELIEAVSAVIDNRIREILYIAAAHWKVGRL